jgi:hypothetical protein
MLNIRTLILSVVLVVVLMLTVQLVTARTEVASDPLRDSVIVLDHQDRYDKMNPSYPPSDSVIVLDHQDQYDRMNKVPIPSYRSPLDECFDVPLSEAAACHAEGQSLVPSYRSKLLDECSDAGLIYRAQCLMESQESTP